MFAVECKVKESSIGRNIYYFQKKTNIPQFYQVHLGDEDYEKDQVRVLPFEVFCQELKMP